MGPPVKRRPPNAHITILMPLKYYSFRFLDRALNSVFNQTDPAWHLLVIADEVDVVFFQELLEKQLRDPRVQLTSYKGKTWSGTLNTGMRVAATPFVAPLFGDDMWAPNAVEVLNHHIAKYPNVDFFHSSRVVIDENDVPISQVFLSRDNFSLQEFRKHSPVKHLLCWRREMALSFGGVDESIVVGPDDYDFPWIMAEKGATFMAIKECLYLYRNHCDHYRLTTHIPRWNHRWQVNKILKKHGVGFLSRLWILLRRGKGLGGQCIYDSEWDRWLKNVTKRDPRSLWSKKTPRYAQTNRRKTA